MISVGDEISVWPWPQTDPDRVWRTVVAQVPDDGISFLAHLTSPSVLAHRFYLDRENVNWARGYETPEAKALEATVALYNSR